MGIEDILSEYIKPAPKDPREMLVPLLQKVQEKFGFIDRASISAISRRLGISESEVYGVATFYAQFRFIPKGRHNIKVCLGTACHVKGGEAILEALKRELHIDIGEVTSDKRFDLERVACVGCCALAPVVVLNDKDVHGRMKVPKIKELLKMYE